MLRIARRIRRLAVAAALCPPSAIVAHALPVSPIPVGEAPIYCTVTSSPFTSSGPWCMTYRTVDLGVVSFGNASARRYAVAIRNLGESFEQNMQGVLVTGLGGIVPPGVSPGGMIFEGSVSGTSETGSVLHDFPSSRSVWAWDSPLSGSWGRYQGLGRTYLFGCAYPSPTYATDEQSLGATCPRLGYDGEIVFTLFVSKLGPSGTRLGDDYVAATLDEARITVGGCTFVGSGTEGCAATGAFVTPASVLAPEPRSLALLGVGLLGLAFASTRRRSRARSRAW